MTACALWTGYVTPHGYGRVSHHGRQLPAHRWVYELMVGPITPGHHVHHRCGVKACVHLDHLVVLPKAEHHRAHNPARATCRRGHSMADAYSFKRQRECRVCRRERRRT